MRFGTAGGDGDGGGGEGGREGGMKVDFGVLVLSESIGLLLICFVIFVCFSLFLFFLPARTIDTHESPGSILSHRLTHPHPNREASCKKQQYS